MDTMINNGLSEDEIMAGKKYRSLINIKVIVTYSLTGY